MCGGTTITSSRTDRGSFHREQMSEDSSVTPRSSLPTAHVHVSASEPACFYIIRPECTLCTFMGGRDKRPSLCLLQRGCWNTHTHPATHSPLPPQQTPLYPPVFPARAPVSKPNTTDQQPGMQIVSGDKLCAACQLHTWGLGLLSVTCVRVPLCLRRTTIMT